MEQEDPGVGICEFCSRNTELTFHHLIPRKVHKRPHFKKGFTKEELRSGVLICWLCHNGLHSLHDPITLGKDLNTIEKLKADPKVDKHCTWVSKQRDSKLR